MTRLFLMSFVIVLLSTACRQESKPVVVEKPTTKKYQKLAGKTMGTTWHITYAGDDNQKHKRAIDSLMIRLNDEVSTYIPTAIISKFNQSEKGVQLDTKEHAHFLKNYKAALKIYEDTKGQFDPTVMPLVNYWGFGYTGREKIKEADKQKVKALLNFVGMENVNLNDDNFLSKTHPESQIDFSALAKGYGVDLISLYFENENTSDYYVEIGGEVRAKGKNPTGQLWTVGISRPEIESAPNDFYMIMQVDNSALATSGNYRNVYTVDGVHYFHTIDPVTGFPKRDRLLSASVVAKDCMTADAYATALMVMGLEKAMDFVKGEEEILVCLIYSDEKGGMERFCSEGLGELVSSVQ
ncbi:MAG: FAD:protein FMN transferase [Saprospiraceae bacterium]